MPSHGAMGNWTVFHIQDSCTHPFGHHGTTQSDFLVSPPPTHTPSVSSSAEEQSACIPVLATNTSARAQGPLSSLALTLNFTNSGRTRGCSHWEVSSQKEQSQESQATKKIRTVLNWLRVDTCCMREVHHELVSPLFCVLSGLYRSILHAHFTPFPHSLCIGSHWTSARHSLHPHSLCISVLCSCG